jgi:F-type H+-transporting ATPase subunit delta
MQNPRLAARYSKSLLDLAVERNSLERTLEDMKVLNSVCTQSHEFVVMLRSPVISGDKKLRVINDVIKNYNVSELSHAFISLLITKGRELNLPEIAAAFIGQYNELKNIRTVTLTTAAQMTDNIKKTIQDKIAGYMPKDSVELKTEVDESIIGGFVIEMGDRLYDASVKKSLNDIRAKIIDNSYVSKI